MMMMNKMTIEVPSGFHVLGEIVARRVGDNNVVAMAEAPGLRQGDIGYSPWYIYSRETDSGKGENVPHFPFSRINLN